MRSGLRGLLIIAGTAAGPAPASARLAGARSPGPSTRQVLETADRAVADIAFPVRACRRGNKRGPRRGEANGTATSFSRGGVDRQPGACPGLGAASLG